jgi:hypothetical protein
LLGLICTQTSLGTMSKRCMSASTHHIHIFKLCCARYWYTACRGLNSEQRQENKDRVARRTDFLSSLAEVDVLVSWHKKTTRGLVQDV